MHGYVCRIGANTLDVNRMILKGGEQRIKSAKVGLSVD